MNDVISPVLRCSAEGDQEGRTITQFGYFQGRLEDILRLTAPKAVYAQARFSDYEIDAEYYDSEGDVLKYLSTQYGLSDKARNPEIITVEAQNPLRKKVSVSIYNEKQLEQFVRQLLPETKWERQNYANGKPSKTLVIEI